MTEFSRYILPIEHVRQPEGTEWCFAACVASATGRNTDDLPVINQALVDGFISDETGAASPPWEPTEVAGARLETVFGYEDQDPEVAYSTVKDGLARGDRIALLHKKTADPESGMHWVLVADCKLMDPLKGQTEDLLDAVLREMIARSNDGVFVVTIQG
ncbi:hypothetical protein EYC59_04935 [Candidatus Saccharibacteria bacterium]|nr:MAG: hypothetical protein EYC59_04935 [Candidatus Saccharibacteria bacterium]